MISSKTVSLFMAAEEMSIPRKVFCISLFVNSRINEDEELRMKVCKN